MDHDVRPPSPRYEDDRDQLLPDFDLDAIARILLTTDDDDDQTAVVRAYRDALRR